MTSLQYPHKLKDYLQIHAITNPISIRDYFPPPLTILCTLHYLVLLLQCPTCNINFHYQKG